MMNSNQLLKFAGFGVFVGKIKEIMNYATETVPGIIEIATQAEVNAGTDDLRAITPLKQKTFVDAVIAAVVTVPAASETVAGKAELATQAETNTGTDDARIVTPLKQKTFVDAAIAAIPAVPAASETVAGKAELATQAETNTGTDDARIVTPLKQKTFVDAAIAAIPAVPAASETVAGKAELATQAETNTGTDDARIVTPLKLLSNIAAKTFITIPFTFDPQNPPVNQTVSVGINTGASLGIIFGVERMYIPKAGVIRRVYGFWRATGTAGSNENISLYIRLNNTTDTLVKTIGDTSSTKIFNKTDLAISVAEGDYIEGKFVFPIWGTQPINVKFTGIIVIEF
jgi:hypothetical protein